jgi:hypothetical protein
VIKILYMEFYFVPALAGKTHLQSRGRENNASYLDVLVK